MDNFKIDPIKNKKTYLTIVETFIRLIAEGKFQYGEKLYNEVELVELFNVSRPTLREALRVMEFLGIVTVAPRKGIRIQKPENIESYMPLVYILMFEQTSKKDLFTLRRAIQIDMVQIAAQKNNIAEIAKLKTIIKTTEDNLECDNKDFASLDFDFHIQIVKCAENTLSYKLMETLGIVMKNQLLSAVEKLTLEDRKKTLNYHRRICELIAENDSEGARKVMIDHLADAYTRLSDGIVDIRF